MVRNAVLGATLFALVGAVPQVNVLARQAPRCNRDNCLRAIVASNTRGASACSSFFSKTVVPCPVTSTVTETTSVVGPATTTTITSPTTTTTSVTVTSTDTVRLPVTTVTATVTTPAPVGPARRQVDGTCTAVTQSPAAVPTYASACSGTARFSSACSCIGVAQSTTTLAPSTVFTTVTQTDVSTPVETATEVPIITETATSTVIASTTVYDTTTTVTATVQPVSGTFNIFNSYYSTDTSITTGREGFLFASFPGDTGAGFPFYLDNQGYLKVFSFFINVVDDPTADFSDLSTPTPNPPIEQRLKCQLSNPLNSSGRLFCFTFRGRTQFFTCPGQNRRYKIGTSVPAGCAAMTLRAG